MLQAPCAAERPARRRHDCDRLMRHDRGEGRTRCPIERILQDAGNAVVELRRAKNQPVALGDRCEQCLDRLGAFLAFEILIVKWYWAEIVNSKLGATRKFLAQCLEYRV